MTPSVTIDPAFIPPHLPPEQRTRATQHLRYEDVAQDGRLTLLGIPHAGSVLWDTLLLKHPLSTVMPRTGVLPILSRIVIEGTGGPIGVGKPVTIEGAFQLAHGVDETGAVSRLFLNTWASITGVASRTHGPPPDNAGAHISVGHVHSESTFTRPFAPPDKRKVLRFDFEGIPAVPPDRHHSPAPASLLVPPDDARPLEPALAPDDAPSAFGLAHTDSNQHVNSLVYPRLFEEAALRRLARLGHPHRLLARRVEIAYRKPAFAGETLRIHLRLFEHRSTVLALGTFSPEETSDASAATKPNCYLRMTFAA